TPALTRRSGILALRADPAAILHGRAVIPEHALPPHALQSPTRMHSDPAIDRSAAVQRDAEGRLRHLITLEGLGREELIALLDLAQFYVRQPGDLAARDRSLAGHTVANLFFEPSTRT